jgi:histidinol-phosphate aminotransferase
LKAIAAAAPDVGLYPDPSCEALRAPLADALGVEPERMVFGNGSEDLLGIATHTFVSAGDEVVTMIPSFGLHILYPQAVGAKVHAIPVREDYSADVDRMAAAISAKTRILFIGNPSNPVGTSITAEGMEKLLHAAHDNMLFVFDEAYYEYAVMDAGYADFFGRLKAAQTPWLMLRTFSKAYALAGLRVGYGAGSSAAVIGLMDRIRNVFNVNRLAQVAAVAAFEDQAWMKHCVGNTIAERERLRAGLETLGYNAAPSLANFLFFDAKEDAGELAKRLLTRGVIVKPWKEAGYLTHVRVSVGSCEADDQFLEALAKERSV